MREKLSARSFLAIRFTKLGRSRALVVWAANISESLPMAVSTARLVLIRRVTAPGSGSVRSQGSLPRAPPADRFSGPVLSDQESRHELPALPIIIDHRAGRANGSWLPALPVPSAGGGSTSDGAEPGSGPDRHRVPLLAAALQAEPAGS